MKKYFLLAFTIIICFSFTSCGQEPYLPFLETETPVETPTVTPALTSTPTVSNTEEPRDTHTVSPVETPTEGPTLTPTLAPTVKPTKAPTKKPTATPAPTPTATPKPTPIPPCTSGEDHDWGPWVWEKYYTLTEEGIEMTTCRTCSAVDRRTSPKGSYFEMFSVSGLDFLLVNRTETGYEWTALDIAKFANTLLGGRHFVMGEECTFELSSEEYFAEIAKRITLTEEMKEALKEVMYTVGIPAYGNSEQICIYNAETDRFRFYMGWDSMNRKHCYPAGYLPQGGDRYLVYFRKETVFSSLTNPSYNYWEVEMIYCNKPYNDSQYVPNRILSFKQIDDLPINMLQ